MLIEKPFSELTNGTLQGQDGWAHDTNAPGSSGSATIVDGYLKTGTANASSVSVWLSGITPDSADYDSLAVIQVDVAANANGDFVGPVARIQGASSTEAYGFGLTPTGWNFVIWHAGSMTVLPADIRLDGPSLTDATNYTVMLRVEGSTLTGFVDNAPVARVTDATISGAGKPGIAISNSSTADTDADTGRAYITAFAVYDIHGDEAELDVYQSDSTDEIYAHPLAWDRTNKHWTCINPGNSIRFSGNFTKLTLNFDIVNLILNEFNNEAAWPKCWLVVNGVANEVNLADGLSSDYAAGQKEVEIRFQHLEDYGDGFPDTTFDERTAAFILRSIGVNVGATIAAYEPPSTVVYQISDSIGNGWRADDGQITGNGFHCAGNLFAQAMGFEFVNNSQNGRGVLQENPVGGGGPMIDQFDYYSDGRSRVTALTGNEPNIIMFNLGTNDTAYNNLSQQTNAMLAMFNKIRTRCPNALIWIIKPFNGALSTAITNAFATFGDGNSKLTSLGDFASRTGTYYLSDGTHPTLSNNGRIAAKLAAEYLSFTSDESESGEDMTEKFPASGMETTSLTTSAATVLSGTSSCSKRLKPGEIITITCAAPSEGAVAFNVLLLGTDDSTPDEIYEVSSSSGANQPAVAADSTRTIDIEIPRGRGAVGFIVQARMESGTGDAQFQASV